MQKIYLLTLLLFSFTLHSQTPTGSSTEVGITDGDLSVSLSGGATYNVPLKLPPGINGVVPELSLSYNSQGGNGYAGYGWDISGVSRITEVPSSKFYDNAIGSLAYALDGQRLLLKSSSSGTFIYETEQYSNIKITHVSTGANYWTVEYPDGTVAYFNFSTSSPNQDQWAISYWQNPQGVKITYDYYIDATYNSVKIKKISYGNLASNTTPVNEVTFNYTSRTRPEYSYVNGQKNNIYDIISDINIKANGVSQRNYFLGYENTDLFYQRLISITEKNGDNSKALNPTKFTYDTTPATITYSTATSSIVPTFDVGSNITNALTSDFSGDGVMDFIIYNNTTKDKLYLYTDLTSAYDVVQQDTGTFEEVFTNSFLMGNSTSGYTLSPNPGWTTVQYEGGYEKFKIYAHNDIAQIALQYEVDIFCGYIGNVTARNYYSGDFNGDGLTDVVAVTKTGGDAYLINLDKRINGGSTVISGTLIEPILDTDKVTIGDFNGDGKSDIYHFKNGKMYVYGFNDSGYLVTLFSNTADSSIVVNNNIQILTGDYNGDGMLDFYIPQGNGSTSYMRYLSRGFMFTKELVGFTNVPYTYSDGTNTQFYIPTDFNNDGKSDLLQFTASGAIGGAGSVSLKCYINTGTLVFNGNGANVVTATTGNQTGLDRYALPIFFGKGVYNATQEIALIRGNKIHYFKSQKDFNKERLLRTIKTGNGVTGTITYAPMVQCSGFGCYNYTTDPLTQPQIFPNFEIVANPNFNVAVKLERQSTDVYQQQVYRYSGAVANFEGLGFLGFKSIYRSNWYQTNAQLISNVSRYDIAKRGEIMEDFTVAGDISPTSATPTTFISRSLYTNDSQVLADKAIKTKTTHAEVYNGLENTSNIIDYTYDDYLNQTNSSYTIKSGTTTIKTGSATTIYDNNPTAAIYSYYIGRPNKRNTSQTVDGVTVTAEKKFTYTGTSLTETQTKGEQTNYVTEDFTYDTFGNITKKKTTAVGITPREINYVYDTSGRFINKITDAQGRITQNVHDANTGLVTSSTDYKGQTTVYGYDTWGKNTLVTNYLSKTITNTYTPQSNGMAVFTTVGADGSEGYVKYDDLGRKFISGAKNVDGTWSYVQTAYDSYNRVVSTTAPFNVLTSPSTIKSTITYDLYGRPIQTKTQGNKITTITYTGNQTITDDGTQSTTTLTNALGNIISRANDGGTITYTYFPNNGIKQTSYDGIVTTMTQDGWGRKKSLTDSSAGVSQYTYNDLGEITHQVTPSGTTDFYYTTTGQLYSKIATQGSYTANTSYGFDSITKDVKSAIWYDTNGEEDDINYTFDTYKRLSQVQEIANYATYQSTFTYDDYGRPWKEAIYADNEGNYGPGGSSITKTVRTEYSYGHKKRLVDDDNPTTVIWETGTVNARGEVLTGTYGNGIAVTNTYDDYGFVTQMKHDKTGSPVVNVMTLNNVFDDQLGNLTSRNNSLFGYYNESFSYDTLDRLTEYTNARGEQETQNYDTRGKITDNYLGTYNYSYTKPYQQESIDMSSAAKAYYRNKFGLFNTTMENKQGWITNGTTVLYDSTKAYTGSYSLKLSYAYPQTIVADHSVNIDNAGTTQYTASAWVYIETGGPSLSFTLSMKDAAGTVSGLGSGTLTGTAGSWQYISYIFNINAPIKNLTLKLNKNGGGNVWFDDIRIVKTSDAAPASTARKLNVTYDYKNDPIEISELANDRITFTYNSADTRSAMYYGSMDTDPTLRPYRKFYSAGGTIEIKQDVVANTFDFTLYVGGDGYTAPAIFKKTGTAAGVYYYLHRDYQGSIMAVTNAAGAVVEKRLYDAWGNIIKVQDGSGNTLAGLTILDRGYTGHEHLQSINLIHMNGRLYDPVVHRFLQVDNNVQNIYNPQNYNRYSYVLNNPLKYTDPSGEVTNGGDTDGENENTYVWLAINGGQTIADNWGSIKKFFNHDNFNIHTNFKDVGNWASNQLKSVNKFFDRNLRSIGDLLHIGKHSHVSSPMTPQVYGQNTASWQASSFQGNNVSSNLFHLSEDDKPLFGTTFTDLAAKSIGNFSTPFGKWVFEYKYETFGGTVNTKGQGTINLNTTIKVVNGSETSLSHDGSIDIGKFSIGAGLNTLSAGYDGTSISFGGSFNEGLTFGHSYTDAHNHISGSELTLNPFKAFAAAVVFAQNAIIPFLEGIMPVVEEVIVEEGVYIIVIL